jgi:hypothetical protein
MLILLWDGHLARPDQAGKMPTPQDICSSNNFLDLLRQLLYSLNVYELFKEREDL